jgi:glucokinase
MENMRSCWAGVDLGATKILATVFDGDFSPIGRKRTKTKGHEGVKAVIERILRTLHRAIEEAEVTVDQLAGIGVGVPGPVDMDRGIVLEAVNLSWENVCLSKMLENEFGCRVEVLNDVDAGVYGEYCFGVAQSARTVLGVFPGTGIGGGCVYDGEIIRGRAISGMEIGHLPVNEGGRLCGCGLRGCLETEASRLAIAADVAAAAYRGETPHLIVEAGTDVANIRSGVLASAIAKGDRVVEEIVRKAADRLGAGIAGAIHLLAPDMVLLGGGLAEAMPELYVQTVAQSTRRHVMPSFADSFVVRIGELGDDAAVVGAAAWAKRQIERSNATAHR